jgi:hypothetical protein
MHKYGTFRVKMLCFTLLSGAIATNSLAQETRHQLPNQVPPKRSSQITDGFGINSNLPRDPYLPWERWWWTRMFDAGVKWIRIGQYENSSDYTSWDFVEQKRGVYSVDPKLDDYVDSLIDNGVEIQVQLMYGNPMYTSPSGKKPDAITPKPGSFHNDDRSLYSLFWPPRTPDQIEAFDNYVRFMVQHFKGRIHYWALWNEPDIGYWNPWGNPEEFGHLLGAFAKTVHGADPEAKVISGGLADPVSDWAKRFLDACACAAEIDVFAYHTYPGYGQNLNPESMDYGAYGAESPAKLRETVQHYPGIRAGIPFWDDEFNSIPSWTGSDESVQVKYIPRGMLYNWAAGVKTFVWLLAAGTDGNEFDDFGLIHGLRNLPDDFTPRPVFQSFENTNALFSDTHLDPAIKIVGSGIPALRRHSGFPFFTYGFRGKNGKAIVAYWLGAHSMPGGAFAPFYESLTLEGTGIEHPVLIDVDSGEINRLEWKKGTSNVLDSVPVRDSLMAIADESYFDWPSLPEAPSSLKAQTLGKAVELSWELHGGGTTGVEVERRQGERGGWKRMGNVAPNSTSYRDSSAASESTLSYRVRAISGEGKSAYSNVAWVAK